MKQFTGEALVAYNAMDLERARRLAETLRTLRELPLSNGTNRTAVSKAYGVVRDSLTFNLEVIGFSTPPKLEVTDVGYDGVSGNRLVVGLFSLGRPDPAHLGLRALGNLGNNDRVYGSDNLPALIEIESNEDSLQGIGRLTLAGEMYVDGFGYVAETGEDLPVQMKEINGNIASDSRLTIDGFRRIVGAIAHHVQ